MDSERTKLLKTAVSDAYYLLSDFLGYSEMDEDEDFGDKVRTLYKFFEDLFDKAEYSSNDLLTMATLMDDGGDFYQAALQAGQLSQFQEIKNNFEKSQ